MTDPGASLERIEALRDACHKRHAEMICDGAEKQTALTNLLLCEVLLILKRAEERDGAK